MALPSFEGLVSLTGRDGSTPFSRIYRAAPFATTCASLKFLLIGLCDAHALWGLASWLWHSFLGT